MSRSQLQLQRTRKRVRSHALELMHRRSDFLVDHECDRDRRHDLEVIDRHASVQAAITFLVMNDAKSVNERATMVIVAEV